VTISFSCESTPGFISLQCYDVFDFTVPCASARKRLPLKKFVPYVTRSMSQDGLGAGGPETFVTELNGKSDTEDSILEISDSPPPFPSPPGAKSGPVPVSIVNFDPHAPRPITEEATLRAMAALGILHPELAMPTASQIRSIKDDELRQIYTDHHLRRITRLIYEIKDERDRIIARFREASRPPSSPDSDGRPPAAVEKHQRRRMESIIQTILRAENIRVNLEAKEARVAQTREEIARKRATQSVLTRERQIQKQEEQSLAAAEVRKQQELRQALEFQKDQERLEGLQRVAEQKIEKLRRLEAARQERAGRNREALQKVDDEKQQKHREKEIREEERTLAFLRKQHQENKRRYESQREEGIRKQKVVSQIRIREEEDIAWRRKDSSERDYERDALLDQWRQRKCVIREQSKKAHDERLERHLAQKNEIEKEAHEKKVEQAIEREAHLEKRLMSLECEKQRERTKKQFIMQLKREERDQNAAHIARQKEAQIAESRTKIMAEQERVAAYEHERKQMGIDKRSKEMELEKQVATLNATVQRKLTVERTTVDSIRQIAQSYGVDIEEIRKRQSYRSVAPSRVIRVSRVPVGK
jgi:hypothetical protein